MRYSLSVVTPVLNGIRWIDTCISSIHQSQSVSQHIIVDGGSTDGTWEHISHEYPHVLLLRQENRRGMYNAINIALPLIKSPYWTYVNCDDQIISYNIDMLFQLLDQSYPQMPDVIASHAFLSNPENRLKLFALPIFWQFWAKANLMPCIQPSLIYATHLLSNHKFNDSMKYAADLHFLKAVVLSPDIRLSVYNRPTSIFLQRPESLGSENQDASQEERRLYIGSVSLFSRLLFFVARRLGTLLYNINRTAIRLCFR